MFALTFGALSLLVVTGPVHAATCEIDNPIGDCSSHYATSDDGWSARQSYCGSDWWQIYGCVVYEYADEKSVTIRNSSPGGDTQQVCWDAYEDIIEQCREDDEYATGDYEYNGITYSMDFCGSSC